MLMDSLRADLAKLLDHHLVALFAAKPAIDAADGLAALLAENGIAARAFGHLCADACTVAVLSDDDPERVEEALVLLGIQFAITDAARVDSYTLRALQVTFSGQRVLMTIHHHPAIAAAQQRIAA